MIRVYKKLYIAILMTFFAAMVAMFLEVLLLSIAVINTHTVDGAMELLNVSGSWIIAVVRNVMQYSHSPTILLERLNATIPVTVYIFIILWFVTFFRTKFWLKHTLIMFAGGIAYSVILIGLTIAMNTNSIEQGFQIMHTIAWFDAVLAFVMICTCLVMPVLILGDYVEVL